MVPRSSPIAPAIWLLAGCCYLAQANVAWAQQTAEVVTPDASAPSAAPVLDTWGSASPAPAPLAPTAEPQPALEATPSPATGDDHSTERNQTAPDGDADTHVRYLLERIEVQGNARTRPSVILRYLPFRPGRELDVDDTEFTLARYRLLGTGFFSEVDFSLRKGSKRGSVVLVVDVVERNTVVVNGVWLGLAKDADTSGEKRQLTAYGGFDVAETNLAGTGSSLGGAVGLAQNQLALRVRFLDPAFLGTPSMVNLTLLHNRALDFFGTTTFDGHNTVDWGRTADTPSSSYAVVRYQRFGGSAGLGRDLSSSTQLWFHYRLETITADRPSFASQVRGAQLDSSGRLVGKTEAIDFDILQGRSVFSSARANFQFDTRDHPFLPTRGWFLTTWGELGLKPLGSDYAFQRFDVSASYWWHKQNSPHIFRLQLFAGAMVGNVPFFEQYYVGDFNDFLPARMLSLNVDRRPSVDLLKLKTAIHDVRYGQYAAQIAGEYRFPVYRGHRSVYGIDLFLRAGFFAVASHREFDDPAPAYHGFRQIPVDFTANAGFRMDTSAGGIVFSLSNVLGFLPEGGK